MNNTQKAVYVKKQFWEKDEIFIKKSKNYFIYSKC